MSRPGRFPTNAAEERLRAVGESGVAIVPLHGTPAPPLPGHVVDAIAEAVAAGGPAPPPRGVLELRTALAERIAATGREVDPLTEIVVTNGAMHALSVVFRALLDAGDEVLVPSPAFFFDGPIRAAGGVPVYVPADATRQWTWDAEALAASVTPRARVLLLCNPGNPTGHVPVRAEVEGLVAVAERAGLVVVTDEAYEASLWDGATLTSAFGLTDRVLLVRSLGKSLSLPHLRLGLVAGPASLLDDVATVLEWDVLRVGTAPQAAALAVLAGGRAWLAEIHASLAADRRTALACAAAAGLDVVPPRGAPFLFCSAGVPGLGDALVECGVPAVDGVHFQAPGWARVPFGGAARHERALREALGRWRAQ